MNRHFFSTLLLLGFTSTAFATGAAVTYQGRIIQPDGTTLNTGNVQFRIQVRTPDSSNCLMYEETKTIPMTGSNGVFALSLNGSGAVRTDSAAVYDFNRVFANKGTFTFPAGDCGSANTYTPSGSAGRKVVAMFYANGAWEALPSMSVNFVPYAIESTTVGGYGSGDLLRVDHAASEVVAPFTFTDYGKLVDLAAGKLNGSVLPAFTSGQVLGSDGAGGWTAVTPLTVAGLPACATGEYLRVSSGALVCQAIATSGGTVTSITAGAGLTGGTITSSGTIALATVGSGGTGAKLTYDTYGRVTAAASLVESDIPTLSSAGKVSGSAISGTIGNGTAISTSGAIQTSTNLMAGRLYLYDSGGTNAIGFRAPASVTPYVLTYPAAQGANGQTLINDGAGQLSWSTPLAAVSNSASLATGKIWIGDGTGKAQELNVSGDASLSSAGALSLNTVPVSKGGTGLTAAATNGQLLIGNGTGYALGNLTAGSGISVVNSAGGITLSATGSGGTVTNVTGTAPIAVATGSSTPAISIAKSTASVDGYLAATDFATFNSKLGTASSFAGDISGTSAAISVDKIKGSPLLLTTPASGQYLKYNGTNWINAIIDAADIGTGTFASSRMPAFTGDVTSSAGSTALTLGTVTTAKGGTGLTSIGTANQILGVNTGATGLEYKTLTAGSGVTITPAAGTLTINATGSGGTISSLTGDVTASGSGAVAATVAKVNGVSYGASPATNTVPVVSAANTVTYQAVPNAALANSSVTLGSTNVSLGSTASVLAGLTSVGLGVAGTTTGQLTLANGNATGSAVTVQNNAATTAYNFNLPASAGTAGYALTSGGGAAAPMTWTALPSATGSASITTLGTVTTGTWNATTIGVPYGGTGTTTLANHGVLLGQATSPVTATVGTAGTVLQGNSASVDPSFTAAPVYGVNGTTTGTLGLANGAASGATTTLAPSASTTAAYTFTLPSTGGTNGYFLQTNGSGVTSWVAPTGSGTVNSGTANQLAYYSGTGTAVGGLTSVNSSVLTTNGSGVPAWSTIASDTFTQYQLLAGRAGGQSLRGGTAASETLTLDSTASATKGYILIAPSGGNVGIGTTAPGAALDVKGSIRMSGSTSGYTGFAPAAAAGSTVWTLPAADGTNGQLLSTNGSGILSWAAATASGTVNAIPKFTTTSTIGNSMMIDSGLGIGIGTASPSRTLEISNAYGSGYTGNGGGVNSAPAASGGAPSIRLTNTNATDTYGSFVEFNAKNAASVTQNAYIGAISSTGASVYSPAIVIGQQSAASDFTERLRIDASGKVGIGTTTPRSALDVNGVITGKTVSSAASTVDFSTSNTQYTTNSCQAFQLNSLRDGASYTFIVQGTTSATCTFTAYSDAGTTALTVHLPPDNAATTAGKHTIYNFIVAGTHVYVAWTPGY